MRHNVYVVSKLVIYAGLKLVLPPRHGVTNFVANTITNGHSCLSGRS
jgi:hypothetical protein